MPDSADAMLEGGCACGGLRYRLTSAPMFVHCCHCTSCQTETGSAFVLNALIEADRVETLRGAAEPVPTPSESGRGQTIWRCPQCQVALWSNYAGMGGAVRFVRGGTLDSPAALEPDIHIYTRSKLPWVGLPEGARTAETYYDVAGVWPPESLARRQAALDRYRKQAG